jgi:histidine kinase
MPLPTLDFNSVAFIGRSDRVQALNDAYNRVRQHHQSHIVFVQGPSGIGKSFLVQSWFHDDTNALNNNCDTAVFCNAKFSMQQLPYEAIVRLILQFSQRANEKRFIQLARERLAADEIVVLLKALSCPRLRQLLLIQKEHTTTTTISLSEDFSLSSDETGSDHLEASSFERFSYAIRTLMSCICDSVDANLSPCILFLDDVQWADQNSLDLLKAICADGQVRGVLFILAARSDNSVVDDDLPFATSLKKQLKTVGRELTRIQLEALSLDEVNELVTKLLELPPCTTLPLAQIVYQKTGGNAYFATQYLAHLERRNLLRYSLVEYRWTWDSDNVLRSTDLAENVAALLLERFDALDAKTKGVLRLASYLGASFETYDTCFIIQAISSYSSYDFLTICSSTLSDIISDSVLSLTTAALEDACAKGFLDSLGNDRFKFSHDSIMRAVSSQSGLEEGCFLSVEGASLRVGVAIMHLFRSDPKNDMALFAATQALNQGSDELQDCESKLILARLNAEAAERATRKSAFIPAATYLSHGIELLCRLKEHPWEVQYDLTLRLYQLSATVELVCGRHDRCKQLAETVAIKCGCIDQRAQAYIVIADSLRAQAKVGESSDILRGALAEQGEHFPKRLGAMSLIMSARKVKKLQSMSNDDILSLPKLPKRSFTKIKLLHMFYISSYTQGQDNLLILIARRMISCSVELGHCRYSPLSFVAYAISLVNDGDFKNGLRYAELGRLLLAKSRSKESVAITTFFLATFLDHLKKPCIRACQVCLPLTKSAGSKEILKMHLPAPLQTWRCD